MPPRAFDAGFVRAFNELSAQNEPFRGDNLVTNEDAYLDVAAELSRSAGGVYVGVGPEQNFSYIALARPELAVIVDIRRDNALLHLLYKSIFEVAVDRSDFLCRLTSRVCPRSSAPDADAPLSQVLEYVGAARRDVSSFSLRHEALLNSLRGPGLELTNDDLATIRRFHRQFSLRGLDLQFDGEKPLRSAHPSLEKLLRSRSADGRFGSFLDTHASFRFVQELERRDRVWLVTGDFGKPDVLPRLARELRKQALVVRAFYASNVEQYLFGSEAWRVWQQNLRQFPTDGDSLLVRAYLVDRPRHPLRRTGQNVASFTTPLSDWLRCERRAPSATYHAAVSRDDCGPPQFAAFTRRAARN